MAKNGKKVKTEKIYQSLEQWKLDFLPNKVKSEHLFFNKSVDTQNDGILNGNKSTEGAENLQRLIC